MDIKTSKTLSISAAGIIIISFFMPWLYGGSAWDIVRELFSLFSNVGTVPDDIRVYLPFILLALPICSLIVIVNNAKTLEDSIDTTKTAKIVTIIVVALVIISLIYAQANNPFSDFSNVFNSLRIGFYLTLLGAGYYLVDLLSNKLTDSLTDKTKIYCLNCGKQYNTDDAGEFCEECGNEL